VDITGVAAINSVDSLLRTHAEIFYERVARSRTMHTAELKMHKYMQHPYSSYFQSCRNSFPVVVAACILFSCMMHTMNTTLKISNNKKLVICI
jgi:hypothetical protein